MRTVSTVLLRSEADFGIRLARFTRSSSSSDDSSNTAAIAGGVVGAVLGVAIICAIVIFLLIRRKRKNRVNAQHEKTQKYAPLHYRHEVDGTNMRHEMAGKQRPVEHDGTQFHELEGAK